MDATATGAILRQRRDAADLSMTELAERSGVPKASLQKYEGGSLPNVHAAQKIARALGTTVESLWPCALPQDDPDDPTSSHSPEAA